LRIKLHDLFLFIFYGVIVILEKSLGIELMLDFASIYFYHIIKKILKKKVIKFNGVQNPNREFDMLN
jgi:hypothetical protein